MESEYNIGRAALRSSSGSSAPSLRSVSSSDDQYSPAEHIGFRDGPYGATSSRAMQNVTKMALGTASLGKGGHTRHRTAVDVFTSESRTRDNPPAVQSRSQTDPDRRWKVDDKGWMVGSKPNSSPKVLRTGGLLPVAKSSRGMRAATMHDTQMNNDEKNEPVHESEAIGDRAGYESPKVARGRILGSKKKDSLLTTEAGAEMDDLDVEVSSSFPVRNPTIRQVEAYKHYKEKARHNSLREYRHGFGPRRWDEKKDEEIDAVTDAGWEARKTRQWGKIDRLCDELYEACSSEQMTACGADDIQKEENDDALHSMRIVSIESRPELLPSAVMPEAPMDLESPDSPTRLQASRLQRPPLLIQRKPVSARSAVVQLSPIQSSSCSTNIHARSSSSPAINPLPALHSQSLLAAQLRSNSSSPPKKSRPQLSSLQRPRLDEAFRGVTLPCAFPTATALNLEDEGDEPWPTASKHCESSGTTLVRRKGQDKPGLRKWKTLETVPLPFATAVQMSVADSRTASSCSTQDLTGADDHSLEGPELLYSPSAWEERPSTVTFELHPNVKQIIAEAQRLGCEALKQRGWVLWGVKVGMLCWVAIILWALLDAIREGLRSVLWPVFLAWEFGVWVAGG